MVRYTWRWLWLIHLEVLELFLVDVFGGFGGICLVDALRLWRWFGWFDWWRHCYIDDLETWHLTWSISWVGSQEPCLLVLACESIMMRMVDVTRWDDDQIDGYAVAVTVPYFTLLASWVLHTLRVGFLKPLLVGSKRTLVGSSIRVGSLVFSWNWKIWEDWSLPHRHKHIVFDGFYQYIIEFSILIWCLSFYVIDLLYDALMINQCCL